MQIKEALYVLKQAPRAWYSRLDKYLQKQGFKKGGVDNNLYIKADENELLIVVVYVDDIMFDRNKDELAKGFAEEMKLEFEMSIIGELTFYLGLRTLEKNTNLHFTRKILKRHVEKVPNGRLQACVNSHDHWMQAMCR